MRGRAYRWQDGVGLGRREDGGGRRGRVVVEGRDGVMAGRAGGVGVERGGKRGKAVWRRAGCDPLPLHVMVPSTTRWRATWQGGIDGVSHAARQRVVGEGKHGVGVRCGVEEWSTRRRDMMRGRSSGRVVGGWKEGVGAGCMGESR